MKVRSPVVCLGEPARLPDRDVYVGMAGAAQVLFFRRRGFGDNRSILIVK
jgi:hypothetical protein